MDRLPLCHLDERVRWFLCVPSWCKSLLILLNSSRISLSIDCKGVERCWEDGHTGDHNHCKGRSSIPTGSWTQWETFKIFFLFFFLIDIVEGWRGEALIGFQKCIWRGIGDVACYLLLAAILRNFGLLLTVWLSAGLYKYLTMIVELELEKPVDWSGSLLRAFTIWNISA